MIYGLESQERSTLWGHRAVFCVKPSYSVMRQSLERPEIPLGSEICSVKSELLTGEQRWSGHHGAPHALPQEPVLGGAEVTSCHQSQLVRPKGPPHVLSAPPGGPAPGGRHCMRNESKQGSTSSAG